VGVNRVGSDGTGLAYAGDTSVIDYNGNILYRASDTEGVFTIELFYDKQAAFRNKLQFLPDRDIFEIEK
jgi:predicted amidohydrolase